MHRRWAGALVVALLLPGCLGFGGDDRQERPRYSTWPIMEMAVEDVVMHNDSKACPFPYQQEVTCHEVDVHLRLTNLHDDLPVCLCDVWVIAQASDGGSLQPPRAEGPEDEALAGGASVLLSRTWSMPPGVTLERLRLEHIRPYYDSEGATPVRLIADLEVPS